MAGQSDRTKYNKFAGNTFLETYKTYKDFVIMLVNEVYCICRLFVGICSRSFLFWREGRRKIYFVVGVFVLVFLRKCGIMRVVNDWSGVWLSKSKS